MNNKINDFKTKMKWLESITIFIKAVELGSFASTSKQMKLDPTTIKSKIDFLEKKIGYKLLFRACPIAC